jgi:DNA-binding LytR/AlgR family response regulator
MSVSCVITDDEPMARKGLQSYVERIPYLELIGVCEDALQLNELLQVQKPDLVFLDIEMPYLTGIEVLKSMSTPPKVILTTAYEQYALEGFELDVLDYLLKPIPFERFLKATNKASEYFNSRQQSSPDFIFIKVDKKLEKVVFKDIVFIEALENYISIQTKSGKWLTHATLKSMQELLPSNFVQTHKSWIVNTDCITTIEGNVVHCGMHIIHVSKYMKEEVMALILKGKMLNRGGTKN